MLDHLKQYQTIYLVIGTLIGLAALLYQFPPNTVVEYIGVENSYLTVFLIAAIGGLSSITSSVFYAAVATFSAGGASPWLLGLCGGIGIAFGDSVIFGLFSYGLKNIKANWTARIKRFDRRIEDYPRPLVYLGLFLILGLTPIPNDIIMFALVVLGFEYKKIAPVLILAGISVTTITAFLGDSAISFIS